MAPVAETTPTSLPPPAAKRLSPLGRLRLVASGLISAVLGLAPHILHHAGPLAGAALFAGSGGSLLFGAIGLAAAVPFLVRMKRRCGGWRRPLAALVLFAAVFLMSTLVVGPALTGADSDGAEPGPTPTEQPAAPSAHEQHH